ncbi:PspA/IM30 family protein [Georgenia sp. SYP-B2076]|uniref:PspA/IM30 family protein n=1 Tax=Georgenia sp. SYP-B2076 TaxID=2495881 RepID=UPI000F8C9E3F|nr:PspA/IM30 family protein [Georgenia sp. SYP-B2076]
MPIGRRLPRILRANKAARQTPTDPIATFEAARLQQLARLDEARRAVADLVVERRRVELLGERATAEVAHLGRQAEAAVAAGDDDGAREHLRRGLTVRDRLQALDAQWRALDATVHRLERAAAHLEDRARESEARYRALRADHAVARASLQLEQGLDASARGAAVARAAALEAERQVRQLQAHAAAREELAWTDPDSARVRAAFEELETGPAVEDELARLKARKGIDPRRPGPR